MKILIITQYFWPENFKVNDLAKGLVEKGHEVTVLTGLPNYPKGSFSAGYSLLGPYKEQHSDGYTIYRSPLMPRFKSRGFQLLLNYFSFVVFATLRALTLMNKKFDHIFVYEVSPITVALPAIFYKFFKKTPITMWVTDLWPESLEAVGAVKNKKALKLVRVLVKFIYDHCDKILMASNAFRDSIKSFGVPDRKLEYFPQWAEDFYYPVTTDPNLPQFLGHEHFFKLMFAGNIGEAQAFDTLIKAAALLKDNKAIHWYILGDGRKKEWAMEEVNRLGLKDQFHFLGSFPPEQMSNFFYYADAMIVSLKKAEIFSLTIPAKIQTYMACGKMILGSLDGEGARIISDSRAGFCSSAEDLKSLAQDILKLQALCCKERTQMQENAFKYFRQNFERDSLINQCPKLFSE